MRHVRTRQSRSALLFGVVALALVAAGIGYAPGASAATGFSSHLTRAPYLTDLVQLNVDIGWATDQSATTGSLKWGPTSGGTCPASLPNTMTATRNASSITVGGIKEYQWKAVPPLPGQGTYCYRPFLASTDLLGTAATPGFTTQVAAGDTTPFSFDVFGDWGYDTNGDNADQAALFSQIAASGARFAVTVGDNGYPSGSQTNYGDLQQTGSNVSAIFGENYWTVAGSTVPLFNTVGNHGLSSKAHTDLVTWTQGVAASTSNGSYTNQTYPCCGSTGPVTYGNDWYAFDAGPARFYILDSAWGDTNTGGLTTYAQDYANHFAPGTPEYAWLLADLQAHPGVLKFAFGHYPFYSDSPSQGSDTSLTQVQSGASQSVETLLGQHGVKMVFNGHAHFYQRNNPSGPGMPITYVTGGGGALLQPVGPCSGIDAYGVGWSPSSNKLSTCGAAKTNPPPSPLSSASVHHFLKVTVSGDSVTVSPTNANGQVFDQQTYDFTPVVDTFIDSAPPSSTNDANASLSFHSSAAGATYACTFDGAGPTPCTSPRVYNGLADGGHTFSVTSTAGGVTDPSPATASWTVDTVAPTQPQNLTADATAPTTVHLAWSASSDSNGVAQYDIVRSGAYLASISGSITTYVDASATAGSTYSYTVDARDAAGNISAASTPAVVTTPDGTTSPTFVQAGSATGSSTAITVTMPAATTQSDLLVLSASVLTGATNHITSVKDNTGRTWTKVGVWNVSGHNSDGELWYSANSPSISSVTVNLAAGVSTAIQVQEFAGIATSSPLDVFKGQSMTSNATSSLSVTPGAGNELVIGFVAGHANAETITVTSAGFTMPLPKTTSGSGSTTASVLSGYEVLGTPSAQTFTATFTTAMYWASAIAVFKAAG